MWMLYNEGHCERKVPLKGSDRSCTATSFPGSLIFPPKRLGGKMTDPGNEVGCTVFLKYWRNAILCRTFHRAVLSICAEEETSGMETSLQLFEKGCRKKCTRQSRKVLWVVLSSPFFKQVWKNGERGHGRMFRVLKESNKSRFDSYSVRNSVLIISQITFRNFRVHIFSDNLSRNSCINIQQGLEEYYWIPGIDRNGVRFREEGKFLDGIWDLTTTPEVGFAKFLARDAVYWKDCPRSPCKLGPEGPVCKPSSPSWKYAPPSLSTANRDFKIWGRNGRKTLYKKWICVLSIFIAIIFTHLLCQNEGEPSWRWIPENRVQVQKEK